MYKNNGENVHRFAREREREKYKILWKLRYSVRDPNYGIILGIRPSRKSITKNKDTHQALPKRRKHQTSPSVSITPKSMTYRDTAYLKTHFP